MTLKYDTDILWTEYSFSVYFARAVDVFKFYIINHNVLPIYS
jgi:hypothetical protein